MKEDLKNKLQILIPKAKIQKRVQELATTLTKELSSKKSIVAIGVMNGAFRFYSDLLLNMNIDVICDFYSTSSYGVRNKPSTEIRLQLDTHVDIKDKHVLLIEDIVDRGITIKAILKHLAVRQPKSITTVTLISKPDQWMFDDLKIDHIGFQLKGDPFLVGYGMDYQEQYRNLPYIAALKMS